MTMRRERSLADCMDLEDVYQHRSRFDHFFDLDWDYTEINSFRWLLQKCQQNYSQISIDNTLFGGIPHLNGIRLSVGEILGRLYVLGSIKAVVDYYAPDLDESQVREAIAFAQDFLEMACDPHQAND